MTQLEEKAALVALENKKVAYIEQVFIPDFTGMIERELIGYLVTFDDGTKVPIYPPEYHEFMSQVREAYDKVS